MTSGFVIFALLLLVRHSEQKLPRGLKVKVNSTRNQLVYDGANYVNPLFDISRTAPAQSCSPLVTLEYD